MSAAQRGFLLLCSHLGNPDRNPLTTAQLRQLTHRVRQAQPQTSLREMVPADLTALGYAPSEAERILRLLSDEALLERYLQKAAEKGCVPLVRPDPGYPRSLRRRLGSDAPGCLWYRGDPALLQQPLISLVGSRELWPENAGFARQAGLEAARQGFVLVSGNARGADKTAQNACLAAGGRVISVVADELCRHFRSDVLYLSEDGFDLPFSAQRALSRNRVIHALGAETLVVQSTLHKGGSWDGTVRNLRAGWNPVFCFDDHRESTEALLSMGAGRITEDALADLRALQPSQTSFL